MKNSDLTVQTYMHFDPERHLYSIRRVDTDEIVQELISTTQIMEKHGLSVSYDNVPEHIMEQAKLFGKIHHKYLEKYFRGEALIEELPEITQEAIKLLESRNMTPIASEKRVNNGLVAGTIDLLVMTEEGKIALIDYKLTYIFNAYPVKWQTNIYRLLVKAWLDMEVEELYCLWYNEPKKEWELRSISLMDDMLVQELFQAELDDKIFIDKQNDIIKRVSSELKLDHELSKLNEAEEYVKTLKANVELIKKQLMDEMEEYGVKNFETKDFKITYVEPSKSVRLDTKKLEEDLKEVINFDDYKVESVRKGYLKITKKEVEL